MRRREITDAVCRITVKGGLARRRSASGGRSRRIGAARAVLLRDEGRVAAVDAAPRGGPGDRRASTTVAAAGAHHASAAGHPRVVHPDGRRESREHAHVRRAPHAAARRPRVGTHRGVRRSRRAAHDHRQPAAARSPRLPVSTRNTKRPCCWTLSPALPSTAWARLGTRPDNTAASYFTSTPARRRPRRSWLAIVVCSASGTSRASAR